MVQPLSLCKKKDVTLNKTHTFFEFLNSIFGVGIKIWITYNYVNAGLFFDQKVILNVLEVTLFLKILIEFIAAKPNQ